MNIPIMFLDIETTGLVPKEWKWDEHYKRFPRIVSITWKMLGEVTSTIINQRGVPIPKSATEIHGIDDERASQSEYCIDTVLCWLIEDSLKADYIVGHNIYFDTSIIKANAMREFGPKSQRVEDIIRGLDKTKRIDVMRRAAKWYHGWSTSEKLYERLFGKHPKEDAMVPHNSYDDVMILERNFNELVNRNIIQLQ